MSNLFYLINFIIFSQKFDKSDHFTKLKLNNPHIFLRKRSLLFTIRFTYWLWTEENIWTPFSTVIWESLWILRRKAPSFGMEETKIIYYIDDEDTPYLIKLPIPADRVNLGDFKNALNRPNYKFFFKSVDDDFGWVKTGCHFCMTVVLQ